MYTVYYRYFNYPVKEQVFETYKAARGFFNRVQRDSRVKYVELKVA